MEEHDPERASKQASVWRPLFPEVCKQSDLTATLLGVARYLRRNGYWPHKRELRSWMKCNRTSLAYCMSILHESGHLRYERTNWAGNTKAFGYVVLTSLGWEMLGLKPIEPWQRPPAKSIMARIARSTAQAIRRDEALRERRLVS